ncbi:MAG: hypothetical protein JSW40_08165 [Candidatus Omnitrophota bacterium]|nr:MAG: hypothetical protein JSW40_08165 [Candidatus Omnitrophota bacterium]
MAAQATFYFKDIEKIQQEKSSLDSGEDPLAAKKLSQQGYEAFLAREFNKAIDFFQRALPHAEDTSRKAYILFMLSSCYLEMGIMPYIQKKDDSYYKKSIEYAKECLRFQPNASLALANIGVAYMNMNELKKADYYFTEAEKYIDVNSPAYRQIILNHGAVKGMLKLRKESQ